jgi:hypothetical protein
MAAVTIEQKTLGTWSKPKYFRTIFHRFSAADASEVKLRNRFSVLETDTLEAVQQNPGFMKQEVTEGTSFTGNLKRKILLLGGSHGRGIGLMLQETLDSNFEVSSVVKPNAPLAKVVEDLGKLVKGLSKQDHIVIVGGPGNSLDRHYHYAIEKDLNFIEVNENECGF